MATLPELLRDHTDLQGPVVAHLQRLVGSCGMLADLSFADLLLFAPEKAGAGGGGRFVVLGQVRPTTGQTLHREDLVGRLMVEEERPLWAAAGTWATSWRARCPPPGAENGASGGHPRALAGRRGRRAGPGVGPVGGAQAGAAGTRLHGGVRPLGRMIAGGDFPFLLTMSCRRRCPGWATAWCCSTRGPGGVRLAHAINALHRMGMSDSIERHAPR